MRFRGIAIPAAEVRLDREKVMMQQSKDHVCGSGDGSLTQDSGDVIQLPCADAANARRNGPLELTAVHENQG
jgi:hypothetical protein